jgi:hypothetical protein
MRAGSLRLVARTRGGGGRQLALEADLVALTPEVKARSVSE